MNPDYHKIKLQLLLDEVEDAVSAAQDLESLKARLKFLTKKHKDTLAFSEDPCSLKRVPENIH